jgi:hypothetical protein
VILNNLLERKCIRVPILQYLGSTLLLTPVEVIVNLQPVTYYFKIRLLEPSTLHHITK